MYFVGVDVGTGSARAGVFGQDGHLLGSAGHDIAMWRPRPGWAQQSSADIWQAVCAAVRGAVSEAGIAIDEVAGIGFDATCSLVVSDSDEQPVSIDPDGAADQDVIVWMDHRAHEDAEVINRIGGAPLAHVGGRISPEMQMPKLRWLSRELPGAFARAAQFRDLPDWLVHRASGTKARSLCSLVCKWTYLGHKGLHGEGWDDDFLAAIGLEPLTGPEGHSRIGTEMAAPGESVGTLTQVAASELGLTGHTVVSASLIDAYAGALGSMGVGGDHALALIAGTSACHISLSETARFVPGIWGPYPGALLPGLWANEAGQSAAGALIDTMLSRHGAFPALKAEADAAGRHPAALLDDCLAEAAEETATLSAARHVQPDIIGNRSPLAEPWRRGGLDGIGMETGRLDLARDYLATVQALAYGTRQIIERLRDNGVAVDSIVPSGGLIRNALFLRETADACGCPVILPDCEEPVLLGAAMLGAVASVALSGLPSAMQAMSARSGMIVPRGGDVAAYHDRKYRVFLRMQDDHAAYAAIMRDAER